MLLDPNLINYFRFYYLPKIKEALKFYIVTFNDYDILKNAGRISELILLLL
jgi:hypothetical protein